MPAEQGRGEGMAAAVEEEVVADPQTQDAANSAASEAAAVASTAAPEPMMFSDLVKMADGLISMPFSSWVVLALLATLFTWIAYLFSRHNSLIFVLPLTAGLLLVVESAFLSRSLWTLFWVAVLWGVGVAMYGRLTRQ
jgi:hypothetical protein